MGRGVLGGTGKRGRGIGEEGGKKGEGEGEEETCLQNTKGLDITNWQCYYAFTDGQFSASAVSNRCAHGAMD